MTKRFREGVAKGGETAQMFPRDVFEQLLKNTKVRGIRFYYGRNEGGKMQMVVVGVDAEGNDMLADGEIFDRGFPCPPVCSGLGRTQLLAHAELGAGAVLIMHAAAWSQAAPSVALSRARHGTQRRPPLGGHRVPHQTSWVTSSTSS